MKDTIYRQAAIDACHKTMLDFFKTNDDDKPEFITASEKMLLSVNKAISNALKKLPSAQPQRGKWRDYSDEGYVECPFCHSATNCEDNKDELHYCFSCGAELR